MCNGYDIREWLMESMYTECKLREGNNNDDGDDNNDNNLAMMKMLLLLLMMMGNPNKEKRPI